MAETEQPLSWMARLKEAFGREEPAPTPDSEGARRAAASAQRIANVERFDTLRVEDVMVPRADIVAVDVDTPLSEVAKILADAAHSRLPVYRETLDEPIGVVHIKDVLLHLVEVMEASGDAAVPNQRTLASILRPVIYVPPSMSAADLLSHMRTGRIHMAVVVDEFGGTDGLVTLEDLVEEIVGDIEDEHDEAEEPDIKASGSGAWEAEARAPIEELEELTGRSLALPEVVEDVDTLGGLVFTLAERVPERGEIIVHPAGVEFEILDADPRRVKRMLVRMKDLAPSALQAANGSGK